MKTLKLVVAYDGTDFHGWQAQVGQRTVQDTLEDALGALLDPERPVLHGAGRTDAGVHARGQVVSFSSRSALPVGAWVPALNARLPGDLRVRSAAEVPADFDARRSAKARHYAYRLLDHEDPLWARIAWRPRVPGCAEGLERAARALIGTHDCSAFQAAGSSVRSPICRIERANWSRWEAGVRFDIVADRFLYRMVRAIVGTLVALSRTADPAAEMRGVLNSRDRARAGVTAPARGLCLEEVFYERGVE